MNLKKSCLIAGASGLTGSALVEWLLKDNYYGEIKLLVRKKLSFNDARIKQIEVDYAQLENYSEQLKADDVYCTLGTTIKKAGSQATFKKVDYEYPLQLGKIAKQNNAQKFLIVTAIGSDADSPIFYNKVKGETERDLKALNLPQLYIFRPSLLTGNRKEKRAGEKAAIVASAFFNHLLFGPLKKYRSIHASTVAFAMKYVARFFNNEFHIFESDEIQEIFNQNNKR
jgi:uncharacterized protein YbjT (DUF2867 family)